MARSPQANYATYYIDRGAFAHPPSVPEFTPADPIFRVARDVTVPLVKTGSRAAVKTYNTYDREMLVNSRIVGTPNPPSTWTAGDVIQYTDRYYRGWWTVLVVCENCDQPLRLDPIREDTDGDKRLYKCDIDCHCDIDMPRPKRVGGDIAQYPKTAKRHYGQLPKLPKLPKLVR